MSSEDKLASTKLVFLNEKIYPGILSKIFDYDGGETITDLLSIQIKFHGNGLAKAMFTAMQGNIDGIEMKQLKEIVYGIIDESFKEMRDLVDEHMKNGAH